MDWYSPRRCSFQRLCSYPEYFAGRRWLPDDRVTGIALDGTAAWIETPGGVSKIDYVPMTLVEKSSAFVKRVQDRHLRWGLTADSQLETPAM